jgi:ABC-type transport system involved in cytochrome c biogenesis permease subunit
MRRRFEGIGLGMALAAILATASDASAEEKVKKESVGFTRAYEILGELPMMHEGRIKPIDTVAREEIKSIYTRETIKLTSMDGKTVTSWAPVAAFFDWSVRPKFWDAQAFLSVEYLPLKRFLMADEIRTMIEVVSGKAATSEPDRARLKALAALPEIDGKSLRSAVVESKLAEDDAKKLLALASKLGEETKWLSPEDLEGAQVTVDGKQMPFVQYLDDLTTRGQRAGGMRAGKPKLTDIEQKAFDVGMMLARYRAIRDKETFTAVPLLVTPHPAGRATLNYSAEAYKKAEEQGPRSLAPLELEAANTLHKYLNDIPSKDRAMPGTDPAFDAKYTQWLKEKSAWVPLGVIREVPVEELAKAGFPASKVEAFRVALKAMEDEEKANPGQAGIQPAMTLIEASRDLGRSINAEIYPTPGEMSLEVHFNELAPFFKAPIAYGLALLAFIMSLIVGNFGVSMKMEGFFGKLARGLYLAGIAGFGLGIGLEAYGFFLRIKISGWAPVTNMYETVIWVGMISAILGLVLEAIYRKTYAALAGTGIAMVCTALAATVPMLDPDIPQLPPVLRSNYWLTIHVLTIVSSYAAFALAMGLGVAATSLYLTATYKRRASLFEMASPLLPGLPLLALGFFGGTAWADRLSSPVFLERFGLYAMVAVGSVGFVMIVTALFAVIGELINRAIFRDEVDLDEAALAGSTSESESLTPAASAGGVAVLTRAEPQVATATRPKADARARAMQSTAAMIKPITNFIYRSMQVGILLVAAGTFLGGWWADVSWGRFWGWDPKEVWALITLLVYLIPLHGRFAGWVNTFWLVMASVICFLSVLMAWYGVNFVLGVGLHSYGFTEGGSQGTVGAATLVLLAFAGGAFWRRRVSSRVPSLTL